MAWGSGKKGILRGIRGWRGLGKVRVLWIYVGWLVFFDYLVLWNATKVVVNWNDLEMT